jgi:hypothetical protein
VACFGEHAKERVHPSHKRLSYYRLTKDYAPGSLLMSQEREVTIFKFPFLFLIFSFFLHTFFSLCLTS